MDGAVLFGLFIGNVGEVSGHRVVGLSSAADEVQRHHGELGRRPALEKEDLVSLGYVHQLAELGLCVLKNLVKHL